MQDEGFHVNLTSLADFQQTVTETIELYTSVLGHLELGDISKAGHGIDGLLGRAGLPGSTRVYEASRTMLGNYITLYDKIIQAHRVIITQLGRAEAALADNLERYSRHEARQEAVFRDLLNELPGAEGGDRGTTGQG